MRTQRQYSSVRLPGAGLLLIGLVALTAVFMGHDVARADFTPQFTLELSTQEPEANPNISTSLRISAPQPNFAALIAFTPFEFGVPKASDMPIGAVIAELSSDAILGLINGACSTPIQVEFTFFNASVDINDTIDPLPLSLSDNLQNLAQDVNPQNFIPDGAERYPSYLKDDDVFGNTQPRARYFGTFFIESAKTTVILNFVFFDVGVTPNSDLPLDPRLGYPNVTVLQDPTVVAPGLITDFCTPLAADTTVFGISKNNPNTGKGEGHMVRQNPESEGDPSPASLLIDIGATQSPPANVGGGDFNFINFARSQRDADGDGWENTLDTCPFHTNVEDPRVTPGQGGDPDLDAIDSACDPDPANLCIAPQPTDCDNDGFLNRGDNCPQIANGLDQDSQADDDDDAIGDACDTPGTDPGIPGVLPRTVAGNGPNVADGLRTDIVAVNPVHINFGDGGGGGGAPTATPTGGGGGTPTATPPPGSTPTATPTVTPPGDGTPTPTATPTVTPPECDGVEVTVFENLTSSSFSLNCSDRDTGDTLTCSVVTPGTKGRLNITSCDSATYTPDPNETGSDTITYKANDGTADSATATVSITLKEITEGLTLVGAEAVLAGESTDLQAICAEEQNGVKPVPGVDITFKIDPGSVDADLDGQDEVMKTSDADGVAEVTLNAGSTVGDIVVSATADDCGTDPQTQTDTHTITVGLALEETAGPTGGAAGGADTGVGSLAPIASSIPAWAAAASAFGGAGLLGGLGALASRVLRRRRQ